MWQQILVNQQCVLVMTVQTHAIHLACIESGPAAWIQRLALLIALCMYLLEQQYSKKM